MALTACEPEMITPGQATAGVEMESYSFDAPQAREQEDSRAIEEFVAAQQHQLSWTSPADYSRARIDYTGSIAASLYGSEAENQPTFAGSVTEVSLEDGRAIMKINFYVSNAIAWVEDEGGTATFGKQPEPGQLYSAGSFATGSAHLEVEMIMPHAGAAIPDLYEVLVMGEHEEIEITRMNFSALASDKPADSGRYEGMVKQAHVSQQGSPEDVSISYSHQLPSAQATN